MNKNEAFDFVARAVATINTTLQGHQQLQQALAELKPEVEKETTEEDKD